MRILFLAPHPFFQERGTPIAVRETLSVLGRRPGVEEIDLVTYSEGVDVVLPRVRTVRSSAPSFLRNVRPGASWRKLCCDLFFSVTVFSVVAGKRRRHYDLVHAVEESVFLAAMIKLLWGVPFVYDMDSCLSAQVTDKWTWTRPLARAFRRLERAVVRRSVAVVAVCRPLAAAAESYGSPRTFVVRDFALSGHGSAPGGEEGPRSPVDLREEVGPKDGLLALYVGNLEHYQGVDLLTDAFRGLGGVRPRVRLAVIGGTPDQVARLRAAGQPDVFYLGARPLAALEDHLAQADLLISPRRSGDNTPMKIYSYLRSGRPVIATSVKAHEDVLDDTVAVMVPPEPAAIAAAVRLLAGDPGLRERLGSAGRARAVAAHSKEGFEAQLGEAYDAVEKALAASRGGRGNVPDHPDVGSVPGRLSP